MTGGVDAERAKRNLRWRGTLACLTMLALAAGCHLFSAHSKPYAPDPVEDLSSNPTRIAAMLSIHAYARWPNATDMTNSRLMSLTDAATYLGKTDTAYFANSRRRRAIAKLAGYALGRPDVDNALSILGMDVKYLHEQLDKYRRGGDAPLPSSSIESIAYDLDPLQQMQTDDCPTKALQVFVPDTGLPAAIGSAQISVGTDLHAGARALDPQSWDVCSKFFRPPERTYLSQSDGTPAPAQPPGNGYDPSLLLEFYTCPPTDATGNPTGCDAWFKNLLDVYTWWDVTGKTYEVRYSLDTFLAGKVFTTQTAELTTDTGGATVDASGGTGQLIVSGWKTLTFKNLAATGMTKALFTVMADELNGELAELACCPIPPSVSAPN